MSSSGCYDQETPRMDETPDRFHGYGAIGLSKPLATTVESNGDVARESAESAALGAGASVAIITVATG
ncbi:MAG: hypothetical protein P1T08_17980 [Acidimicrobiia bacterium]|nr:hypothetical protein [Acidimicrobiia bacterium]